MTDRHRGYVVVLREDIREGDAEAIISAIGMIKGVIGVKPVTANTHDIISETRIKNELHKKLWEAIK